VDVPGGDPVGESRRPGACGRRALLGASCGSLCAGLV